MKFGRSFQKNENSPRVNEEISVDKVRLIGADGSQVGVVDIGVALSHALEAGLDLVEIAPQAKPPVCKIIDYGKFRYDQSKKEKDARKKQHTIQVKKVRMSPNIDMHDLNVKLNMVRRFLSEGNRVKITMFMRGRQTARPEIAKEVLLGIVDKLSDISKTDGSPKLEGRSFMTITLLEKY